jgi:23S rRNA pseudouridine2457 synthase
MPKPPAQINNRYQFAPAEGRSYLAFYKPFQVLCQFSREPGSTKASLADFGFPQAVYPVGRLDYDSEGLLLLSDDGRLNTRLLHPKERHQRKYLVQVENQADLNHLSQLERGVIIEGRRTLPAKARLLDADPEVPPRSPPIRFRQHIKTSWLELTLVEGRNRQVRKMTAHVGLPTLRLIRSAIGRLDLWALALEPGNWRQLTVPQIDALFQDQ